MGVLTWLAGWLIGSTIRRYVAAAGAVAIAMSIGFGVAYWKGYSACKSAADIARLERTISLQKGTIADLRDQVAQRDELARRAQARAAEAEKERQFVNEQLSDIESVLDSINHNPICADADTARMLDQIGRH